MRSRIPKGLAAAAIGTMLATVGTSPAISATPEEAMTKAGCVACHTKDKKLVGPSFKDIAARYKGQANAVTTLSKKVREGGKGTFGPVPMSPNPPDKISDTDLKAAVEYILAQ